MVMEDETGGMISHEQSAEVDFDSTENAHGRRLRKRLISVFVGLVAVAAVLLVAIALIVINTKEKDDISPVVVNEDDSVVALNLNNNITYRMMNDPDYGFSGAVSDFENAINESSGDLRVSIAIYYAYFLENNGYSLSSIVEMLEELKPEDMDIDKKLEFYFVLEDFYSKIGDLAKLEAVSNEVNLLSPGEKVTGEQFEKAVKGEGNE